MNPPRQAGFRLTERDREVVRWIGRLRMATAAQVAERFQLGRAVSYARLAGLVRIGLLEHARIFHAAPGAYLTTRKGLSVVDLALPPARIDLRTYEHDIELSGLVTEIECEFGADRLATEREMRAADTPIGSAPIDPPRFAISLTGARGQLSLTPAGYPRLHFPDCAASVAGWDGETGVVAIELERTIKNRARLRRILAGYVAARHIARVRYYVTNQRVRALVEREAATLTAGALLDIHDRFSEARREVGRPTRARSSC